MPGRLTMPRGQSFQPRKPFRGSQPTGAQGRREGEVGGIEEAEEAAIEYDVVLGGLYISTSNLSHLALPFMI